MTPVEELQEAARRIRELAGPATPGPWCVPRRGTGIDAGEFDTVIGPGDVDCMSHCYGGISTLEGDRLNIDQAYIASWHPAVALAVAEWLEEEVETWDFAGRPQTDGALAVARAYLGRSS